MNSDNPNFSPAEVRSSRRTLLVIMAIVVVPFLLAYTMFRTGLWMPVDTTNKGALLLPPLHVDKLGLRNWAGDAVDFRSADGRWTMIIVGEGGCEEACKSALYLTRQAHIGLGKEAGRVLRYYGELGTELDPGLATILTGEHPRLVTVDVERGTFVEYIDSRVPELGLDFDSRRLVRDSYVFIADPLGNIMLYFTPSHSGKDILTDLKKLLKNSKLG